MRTWKDHFFEIHLKRLFKMRMMIGKSLFPLSIRKTTEIDKERVSRTREMHFNRVPKERMRMHLF